MIIQNQERLIAKAADTLLSQDTPLSADEAKALDLLLSFSQEQLELMLVILEGAFGPERQ